MCDLLPRNDFLELIEEDFKIHCTKLVANGPYFRTEKYQNKKNP